MKRLYFIFFILPILLIQCKSNIDPSGRNLSSPRIYQIASSHDFNKAKAVIDMVLTEEGFAALSDTLYTKQTGETGLSVQFEKGFSKTLYFYMGAIDNFDYIPMSLAEKQYFDELVQYLRSKLSVAGENAEAREKLFSDKEPVIIHTFRFADFDLKPFNEFMLFSCTVKNESRYQFLNIGITFHFQNAYGTVVETKQIVLNYLAPWQKRDLNLTLSVNQNISDFFIRTSVN